MEKSGYKRLDWNNIKIKSTPISSKEALKGVTPIPWSKDVMDGKKTVTISRQK